MCATIEDVLAESDVIIIGNRDKAFATVPGKLRQDQIVIDLARISDAVSDLNGRYQGICW